MTRPKSEKRQRTHTVGVRVTDAEYAQLEDFASAHGMTVSKALRVCFAAVLADETMQTASQNMRENRTELRLAATS